ncbi:MAG: DNA topoisomerase VI, partial [Zestosphaera sp.]
MSSSTHLTSKDLSARSKALEVLRSKFNEVIEEVMNGRTPTLVIRKRTLTNTIYDEVNGLLKLGEGVLKRSFLNVNESKKFMQTLLMASIIYESLKNNEYPTIRDLYYRGKHTIKYRDLVTRKIKEENTWDEQKESDSVIRDLEVFIDMLREDMLILSKEKGKVVGNMRIRSGDDVIDLSKMGHGAYSIEPTPDLIEFLDYDVEYVLVIE